MVRLLAARLGVALPRRHAQLLRRRRAARLPGGAVDRAVEAEDSPRRGGFGKPKPPLFPREGGRHRQRAFRDALCDILPPKHGFLPTLRIADFEVQEWLQTPNAPERMRALLDERL